MVAYILRRCGHAVVVVFGVSLVVFLLSRLAPGDPVTLMLAETASPQQIEEARRHYGLDRPLPAQYALFLSNAVRGDMGESLYYKQPALRVVLEAFPQTAILALSALALAIVVALPLGVLAAVRRDTFWDYLAVGLAVLGQAAPAYWVGIMLILIFSVALGILPTSGNATPQALILPAITLGAALMAVLTRLTRAGMLDVLNEDYIRTARAKGLRERATIMRHGLRNVLIPLVTVVGLQLGGLLGGAVIIEQVFSWPGVGRLAVTAITSRDYPIIQAAVLLVSCVFVVVNLLVDIGYAFLDPRIRFG
jgi:peptide/nickel transport system permease protein